MSYLVYNSVNGLLNSKDSSLIIGDPIYIYFINDLI